MSREYRYALPNLNKYDVIGIQQYLRRQAQKGWFLLNFNTLATFHQGEPKDSEYVLIPKVKRNADLSEEESDKYKTAGYTYVCDMLELYYVFIREKDEEGKNEFSDSFLKEKYEGIIKSCTKRIRKSRIIVIVSFILLFFMCCSIPIIPSLPELMKSKVWLNRFTVCMLGFVLNGVALHDLNQEKRMLDHLMLAHSNPRRTRFGYRYRFLLMIPVFFCLCIVPFISSGYEKYQGDAMKVCPISLFELEQHEQVEWPELVDPEHSSASIIHGCAGYVIDRYQFAGYQNKKENEVDSCELLTYIYQWNLPVLKRSLCSSIIRSLSKENRNFVYMLDDLKGNEVYPIQINGYEEAYSGKSNHTQYLILRQDNIVYVFAYRGRGTLLDAI